MEIDSGAAESDEHEHVIRSGDLRYGNGRAERGVKESAGRNAENHKDTSHRIPQNRCDVYVRIYIENVVQLRNEQRQRGKAVIRVENRTDSERRDVYVWHGQNHLSEWRGAATAYRKGED